jgi:hypothetical protein
MQDTNVTAARDMETKGQFYEIRVEGHLGTSWVTWFEGLDIRHEENGETVLSGIIVDQTALHGVLMKIRDLGLPLVAVRRLPSKARGGRPRDGGGEQR